MSVGYMWHGMYVSVIEPSWSLQWEVLQAQGFPHTPYLGCADRVSPRITIGLFLLRSNKAIQGTHSGYSTFRLAGRYPEA
jgi:hypothetical protein